MVKVSYTFCHGEAHQHVPDDDHCWLCMPYWEVYPVCPVCERKVKSTPKRKNAKYYCKQCKQYFTENSEARVQAGKDFLEFVIPRIKAAQGE